MQSISFIYFKMIEMRYLLVLAILGWLLQGCETASTCAGAEEIVVPEVLREQARRAGVPYCELVSNAHQGDTNALAQMIRFAYKTEDNSAIEHGIVFTELAIAMGDSVFYAYMRDRSLADQLLAAKMMDACMEFRDPPLQIEQKLPKSYALLLKKYQ